MMKTGNFFGQGSRWYGRIPITITLAAAIGLLVLVTVGVVFGVGVWLAQKNTFDLLSENANQAISADVMQIEQHLRPAEHQVQFLADQIASGEGDPDNHSQLRTMLIGALAGLRQVESITFVDNDLLAFTARRQHRSNIVDFQISNQSLDSIVRRSIKDKIEKPVWGPPFWLDTAQNTYLNRIHPVRRNGEFIGVIVAETAVQGLSNFISDQGLETRGNRFVLYGQNYVLAHWQMGGRHPSRSKEQPLPLLNDFGDPILASIWQEKGQRRMALILPEGTYGHSLEVSSDRYAFVYQKLDGFGEQPFIVGTYFQASSSIKEVRRMIAALIAGIAALLASLIAAIILGHRIAQPIVRFSTATSRIRDLDVSKIEELPGSMFRELNDQSVSFNAMLRALRWFELYVPKKIAERLIRHSEVHETISDSREITVMFTDIAGFSSVSEGMLAPEVASFVNHHFSLIADCIENENGTIDKFMGDAVMAFWGAPDEQSDSAELACRAALAIAASIQKDNRQRKLNGKPPVGIRIGIHTGIATVGNIGAPGRLNYTIIGDTVNIGQRLEQLGKDVYPTGTEVSILISGDTVLKLGSDFNYVSAGQYKLKGRIAETEVFKLI